MNTLGEYLAAKGLKQLHIAETEKYAHVLSSSMVVVKLLMKTKTVFWFLRLRWQPMI